MKRLIKFLLGFVVLFALLLVALAIALPMFLDPNDYKDDIERAVSAKTGRDFSISGPIEWSVFPWVGIELQSISLANAPGFGSEPLAQVSNVGASVKVLPLLKSQIEIGEVSLNGLKLQLGIDAKGTSNWQSILDAMESEAPVEDSDSSASLDLDSLVINRIDISDGAVAWSDKQAGQDLQLDQFRLQASNIKVGESFDLDSGFRLAANEPSLSGEGALAARVGTNKGATQIALEDFEFKFDGELSGDQTTPLSLLVSGIANIDTESGTGTLKDWQIRLFDLVLNGNFDLSGLNDNLYVDGQLTLEPFSPRDVMTKLAIELPNSADSGVLSNASADLTLALRPNDIRLNDLTFKLDDTTLTGTAGVRGTDPGQIRFDLSVDAIDLDRYLPAAATDETDAAENVEPLTVDTFRDLYVDGRFRIGQLTVSGLAAESVDVRVSGDGKGVRLNPLTASFYGGKYSGDIRVDATGSRPMLRMNEGLTGIQAMPLLAALQEGDPILEGQGDLKLQLQTDLSTADSITQALNGDIGFDFRDGAIRGINVAQRIRQAKASLQGKTLAAAEDTQKTDFSEFRATANITNGVLSNDDLMLASPLLRVVGSGSANLVASELDYTIKPVLVTSLEGQGSEVDQEISGVAIPVRLTGPLTEPEWKIDFAAAVKESQKEKIDEKKEELKGRLMGKLLGDDDADSDDATKQDNGSEASDEKASEDNRSSGERRRDRLRGFLGRDSDKDDDEDDPDS